jgi:hypothetical protein
MFGQERAQSFYDFQSGQINFSVRTVIPAVNNILAYLNIYATLYHGYIDKQHYQQKFCEVRHSLAQGLIDLPIVTSQKWSQVNFPGAGKYQTVAFIMYMCRLSRQTVWNFPVLLNYSKWVNGGSRVFATGMTKTDPWNHVMGLDLVDIGKSSYVLSSPMEILSDKMLHHVLGLEFTKNKSSELVTELKNNKLYLRVLENDFDKFNNNNQYGIWDQFATWRSQYPTKPKIKIYTNCTRPDTHNTVQA